jgi:hypothetical protein
MDNPKSKMKFAIVVDAASAGPETTSKFSY